MRLKYKAEGNGKTRYIVERGNQLLRRLEKPAGWQEQIHNGDWHNVIGPRVIELENEFQLLDLTTTPAVV